MKVVGTIVEYNPLHNGHIYAINEIKRLSNPDVLIVVLSGNFTMRADLSIFDKFEKAKQSLMAGIDLIIELPFILTVQNSDIFAANAVKLLNLARVNEIWIGSESNDFNQFEKYYNSWNNKDNQLKIKKLIKEGKSYKEATSSIIDLPSNDLLGFCYYKAIKENNYNIKLNTIKRIGKFNSLVPDIYASAYAIRNDFNLINKYCPNYINKELIRDKNKLFDYLKYKIITTEAKDLKEIFFVDEGIENRLKSIIDYNNYDDFVSFLATKRYTKSRIQRMLIYILFDIKKITIKNIDSYNILRILGYNENGKKYLNSIKKDINIKTNIKNNIHQVLDIEIKITKLLDMIYNTNTLKLEQDKPIYYLNN